MGNRVVYLPAYEAEVEYLESDGNSFIDTGLKASSELGILAHIQNSNGGQNWLFGGGNSYKNSEYGFLANYSQSYSYFYFNDQIKGKPSLYTQPIELNGDKNVMLVGSDVYSVTFATFTSNNNVYLFACNRGGSSDSKSTGVRIYDFKIYQNSTLVRDFIPVRIGTTGYMYDKVSRQLFANAGTGRFVLGNDVANATVPQLRHVVYFGGQRCVGFEKVYEKCAWLKGRNGAYIDTEHIVKTYEDAFEVYARYDGTNKNPDGGEQNPFGIQDGNIRLAAYINGGNNINAVIKQNESTGNHDIQIHKDVFLITLYAPNSSEYVKTLDGVRYTNTIGGTVNNDTNLKMYVFARNGKAKSYFHGDIAYFRITDPTFSINRVNLFPCRLLVDIPAILDGNGIARQAGACGMWDTVSGRFFGNVADRGTFDVVYFEEGVDYEVHQYLAVDMPRGYFMTLPLDSSNFSYQRVYTSIGNTAHLSSNREEYAYFSANLTGIGIWNGSKTMNYASVNISNLSVVCDSNQLLFNSVEFPMYGFPPIVTFYNSSTATNTVLKQSAITVDGVERYIPVKLLRSIPPRHDANGIARQAGECGMYDTVNDLFHGNVASSGTFSVLDD